MNKLDKFDNAANTRQAILDYCNQREFCKVLEVSAYLQIKNELISDAMKKMVHAGELSRTGHGRDTLFVAEVTHTTPGNEKRATMLARRAEGRKATLSKKEAQIKRASYTKGILVNICSDVHPTRYPNQGGQGSLRAGVTIRAIEL